jgi:hypothetical protein
MSVRTRYLLDKVIVRYTLDGMLSLSLGRDLTEQQAAALAGLLTGQEVLQDLQELLNAGIRISPRWQNWLKTELERLWIVDAIPWIGRPC